MINVYRSVDGQIFEDEALCEEHEKKLYLKWYEAAKSSERGTHSKCGVTTRLCDVIAFGEKSPGYTASLEHVLWGYFTEAYGEKPLTEEALAKVEEIEKLPDPVQILRDLDESVYFINVDCVERREATCPIHVVQKYKSAIEDMKKLFEHLEKSDA
jgi:hypothetical protein